MESHASALKPATKSHSSLSFIKSNNNNKLSLCSQLVSNHSCISASMEQYAMLTQCELPPDARHNNKKPQTTPTPSLTQQLTIVKQVTQQLTVAMQVVATAMR